MVHLWLKFCLDSLSFDGAYWIQSFGFCVAQFSVLFSVLRLCRVFLVRGSARGMSARSSTRCEQWRACEPAAAVRRGAASSKPAAMAARLERTLSQVRRSARRPGVGPAPAAGWTRAQLTRQQNEPASKPGQLAEQAGIQGRIFFIFVFKKIKISKIYGGFEKFQNYTPVAPCLGDRGPVALWLGDRT